MPRQIVLASRPSGWPVEDNFALTEADRPDLADGQIRVRNLFMSVDPYMRGRMNDVKSYVPPFRLGEPLEGGAIGTVIRVPLARPGQGRPGPAHAGLAGRGGAAGPAGQEGDRRRRACPRRSTWACSACPR